MAKNNGKSTSDRLDALKKIAGSGKKGKSSASSSKKAKSVKVALGVTAAATAVAVSTKKKPLKVVAIILVIAIVATLVFLFFNGNFDELLFSWTYDAGVVVDGELTVHFLELGNKYTGDCTYIKAGDVDILVDAGSRANSSTVIQKYLDQYVTDGVLEYVIATHADQDHIAALAGNGTHKSIFELYEVANIIQFAGTNKTTTVYKNYVKNRDLEVAEGAVLKTAMELYTDTADTDHKFELSGGIMFEILYQEFYEEKTADENDYSVCFQLIQGEKKFLFTGDLEKEGEASLVEHNADSLSQVELFKGGHHGSKTSTTSALLEVIQPKIVCVCCCAGSTEYTSNNDNTFPTQDFVDRVAPYTNAVYVTTLSKAGGFESMNGNIRVISTAAGVTVDCTNNNLKLYETQWFENYRRRPSVANWQVN
jgi:beta-lactamase superfamily II metal-dependent hydrolase